MTLEGINLSTAGDVPEPGGAVPASRQDAATIGGDREVVDRTGVPREAPDLIAVLRIPELDDPAGASREHLAAIRREGDTAHLAWNLTRAVRAGAGSSVAGRNRRISLPLATSQRRIVRSPQGQPLAERIVFPSGE